METLYTVVMGDPLHSEVAWSLLGVSEGLTILHIHNMKV